MSLRSLWMDTYRRGCGDSLEPRRGLIPIDGYAYFIGQDVHPKMSTLTRPSAERALDTSALLE